MSNVQPLFAEPQNAAESRFAEFWAMCPKKVGKPLAEAKYRLITNGGLRTRILDRDSGMYIEVELHATEQELIDGMKRYVTSLVDKRTFAPIDMRYVLHPATFLNQGRWLDE